MSVGGDLAVTGTLKAASIEGDGARLSNVKPKTDSVTSAQLVSNFDSLSKVSGGKLVVGDGNVGVGTQSAQVSLQVSGRRDVRRARKCPGAGQRVQLGGVQ